VAGVTVVIARRGKAICTAVEVEGSDDKCDEKLLKEFTVSPVDCKIRLSQNGYVSGMTLICSGCCV
jgi:hypothetical protein